MAASSIRPPPTQPLEGVQAGQATPTAGTPPDVKQDGGEANDSQGASPGQQPTAAEVQAKEVEGDAKTAAQEPAPAAKHKPSSAAKDEQGSDGGQPADGSESRAAPEAVKENGRGSGSVSPARRDTPRSPSRERKSRSPSPSRSRSHSRSVSSSRSRSRSRSLSSTPSSRSLSRSRSPSRSRSRARGRSRSDSRRRHRRRSSTRSPSLRRRRLSRSRSRGPRRSRSRDRRPVKAASLSDIRVPSSVRDLFLDSLRDCLGLKRVPFNTSLVNDYMKRRDRRWNVQRELGCSFAQLCQVMEREGHLELLRFRDNWEVRDSKLLREVERYRARSSSRSPPRRRSSRGRSPSPARRRSGRGSPPPRRRTRSPSRERGAGERWEMTGQDSERWTMS